jgi:aspartyl-tRNA synthetase
MLRTHTCGELKLSDVDKTVTLAGWVQRTRDKGGVLWIDLRDRYGITQLILDETSTAPSTLQTARQLGREFVIQAEGKVIERLAKNDKLPTGEIEIKVTRLTVLNSSKVPPFTIDDNTDGGDELRMKYRYLDLRRNPVRESLQLRHRMGQQTRAYLDGQNFIEVETPVLIKSTPEGARDFVVPSRIHHGRKMLPR